MDMNTAPALNTTTPALPVGTQVLMAWSGQGFVPVKRWNADNTYRDVWGKTKPAQPGTVVGQAPWAGGNLHVESPGGGTWSVPVDSVKVAG